MGKTALATNLAYNVARGWEGSVRADGRIESTNGGIVGFFSLEMSAEQLATRIISEQSEIASYRIRRGEIDPGDFDRIAGLRRKWSRSRSTSTRPAAFRSPSLRPARAASSASAASTCW